MKARRIALLSAVTAGAVVLVLGLAAPRAAQAQTVIYQDSFTNHGTDRLGPFTSSLGGTAPTTATLDPGTGGGNYTGATWTFAAETGGWGQTGSGYATPTSSNYLPFTPVAGEIYTLTATIDATNWNHNDDWFTIGFTQDPGNWIPGNFVADLSDGLARAGSAKTISVTLDTTASDWTNSLNLGYVGWFTNVPGTANLNPANPEVKINNFSLTTNVTPAPPVTAHWSGETNATWDNDTVNFTGQSFGAFKTGGGNTVVFADNDGNLIPVPANRTSITIAAGGVEIANAQFDNNLLNYTLNGADATGITGASGVTKSGTGMLTLTGANTYTGVTTISNGTLTLANQNAVQNSTVTMNGGSLVFDATAGGAFTFGGLAASAGYDIALHDNAPMPNPVALTVGGNNAGTIYASVLSGSGNLTKVGTGQLTLAGSNTYSGGTHLNAGGLQINNGSALGSGTLAIAAGAQLTVNTNDSIANNISLAGVGTQTVYVNNGNNPTFTGTISADSSAGMLLIDGADAPSSGHNLTFSGNLALGGKSLIVLGAGSNGPNVQTTTLNNATLTTTGNVGVGRANLIIGGNSNVTIGGVLVGAGTEISSADWGTLTIQGNALVTAAGGVNGNTAAWALNLDGGTLGVPSIEASDREQGGGNSAWLNFNGTRVVATTSSTAFVTVGTENDTNSAFVGDGGAIFDSNGFNIGIGINLKANGGGGLAKLGNGMLTLAGNNTYSGPTTISGGVLRADAVGALPSNSDVTISGGTLDTGAFAQTVNSLTVGAAGTLNLYVGNVLNITGSLNIANGSTLNISNPQSGLLMTYGGGLYDGGTFATPNLPVGYSLDYHYQGLPEVYLIGAPAASIWKTAAAGTWGVADNWTNGEPNKAGAQAVINPPTSGSDFNITLEAPKTVGTLEFGNAGNPGSGYHLVNTDPANTLTLDNSPSDAQITVTDGRHSIDVPVVLKSNLVVSDSGVLAISGSISENGSHSLTLNGPGTLVLSGTGLYTGGTIVNSGTLAVTTSTALPDNQSLTVGAGGTLIFDPSFSASPIMGTPVSAIAASSAGSPVSPVPEPSTIALLLAGLAIGFGVWRRKRIA